MFGVNITGTVNELALDSGLSRDLFPVELPRLTAQHIVVSSSHVASHRLTIAITFTRARNPTSPRAQTNPGLFVPDERKNKKLINLCILKQLIVNNLDKKPVSILPSPLKDPIHS